MISKVVDLPAPEEPMIAISSPCLITPDTPCNTCLYGALENGMRAFNPCTEGRTRYLRSTKRSSFTDASFNILMKASSGQFAVASRMRATEKIFEIVSATMTIKPTPTKLKITKNNTSVRLTGVLE
eukprot:Lithocolla_globosa_v1_NODE_999_length_2967_cov_8.819430.p2 type:complete len:126 gc:universal NODE_999_length_2967_cov_8.819430:1229-852(-)